MANTESFVVEEYITDMGTVSNNLRFKVERGKMGETGLTYDTPVNSNKRRPSCPSLRYFTPRKLVIKFTDGFSIEVIVPQIGLVDNYIGTVLGKSTVACIALKGEKWKFLPPGILGGNYNSDGITSTVDKPDSTKFTYKYELDGGLGGEGVILSTSLENTPADIFVQQQACIDKVTSTDTIKCSGSSGIKPRRFTGQRVNTTTGGIISRQIIVSSNVEDEIKLCGRQRMNSFNCLSYEGQGMANVADYYSA